MQQVIDDGRRTAPPKPPKKAELRRVRVGRPVASSRMDAIGDTPLVDLSRFARGSGGRFFANPKYLSKTTAQELAGLLPLTT
jgi:hypothetical protein